MDMVERKKETERASAGSEDTFVTKNVHLFINALNMKMEQEFRSTGVRPSGVF